MIAQIQDLLDSYLVSYVDTVTGGGPAVGPPKNELQKLRYVKFQLSQQVTSRFLGECQYVAESIEAINNTTREFSQAIQETGPTSFAVLPLAFDYYETVLQIIDQLDYVMGKVENGSFTQHLYNVQELVTKNTITCYKYLELYRNIIKGTDESDPPRGTWEFILKTIGNMTSKEAQTPVPNSHQWLIDRYNEIQWQIRTAMQ